MPTPAPGQHGDAPPRVLIVDDDEMLHTVFRRVLGTTEIQAGPHQASFELVSAYDAQGGLDEVKQAVHKGRPFRVAFVDYDFPGGPTGIEIIPELWRHDPALEVVLCSSFAPEIETALQAAVSQSSQLLILKKPFEPVEVRYLARTLSDKWALRLQAARRIDTLEQGLRERYQELQATYGALKAEVAKRQACQLELLQAQKLRAIGQLAAGIAHELNTPMQYISSNLEFLGDAFRTLSLALGNSSTCVAEGDELEYLRAEIPMALEQAQWGVRQASATVATVRELARPGNQERCPADVNALVKTSIELSRCHWQDVADVQLSLCEPLPPASAEPAQLVQALLNLLTNSAQALSERRPRGSAGKGRILVETESCEAWVHVRIRDDGPGIPENIRERVFEPFFTTKEVGQGIGQGLAVTYWIIVQRHRGRLAFKCDANRGTTFTIQLPLAGKPLSPRAAGAGGTAPRLS